MTLSHFWRKALKARQYYPFITIQTGGDPHGQEEGQGRSLLTNQPTKAVSSSFGAAFQAAPNESKLKHE